MSNFVPLTNEEVLDLYVDDIDNYDKLKNVVELVNIELKQMYDNKSYNTLGCEKIRDIIYESSTLVGKKHCEISKKVNKKLFNARSLTSDEIQKLISLSSRHLTANHFIHIEEIMEKISKEPSLKEFLDYIENGGDDSASPEFHVKSISYCVVSKKFKEINFYFEAIFDKIFNSSEFENDDYVIQEFYKFIYNYFKTLNTKTFSLDNTKEIASFILNEKANLIGYFDLITFKKDLDTVLNKILKDEKVQKEFMVIKDVYSSEEYVITYIKDKFIHPFYFKIVGERFKIEYDCDDYFSDLILSNLK